jgi:hypothetical protein
MNWYSMLTAPGPIDTDEVWFLRSERPPDPPGVRARKARVVHWEQDSGEVDHDGTCDLVLRRTFYPGWKAWIDGNREVRIIPADGGLQSIRLPGSGLTRVSVRYSPWWLWPAVWISLTAMVTAIIVIVRYYFALS